MSRKKRKRRGRQELFFFFFSFSKSRERTGKKRREKSPPPQLNHPRPNSQKLLLNSLNSSELIRAQQLVFSLVINKFESVERASSTSLLERNLCLSSLLMIYLRKKKKKDAYMISDDKVYCSLSNTYQ